MPARRVPTPLLWQFAATVMAQSRVCTARACESAEYPRHCLAAHGDRTGGAAQQARTRVRHKAATAIGKRHTQTKWDHRPTVHQLPSNAWLPVHVCKPECLLQAPCRQKALSRAPWKTVHE